VNSWQRLLFALTVLCAVALLGPVAALANGPSAGDQQYIDPLSGTHHHSKSNSSSSSSTSSSSTPTSTGSTQPTAPATPTTTTTAPAPAATSASSTPAAPSRSHDPSGKTLPFTGFDVWLAAGLGLGLLASGVYLRRVNSQA
jgi:cytoskeletal protein RodZ